MSRMCRNGCSVVTSQNNESSLSHYTFAVVIRLLMWNCTNLKCVSVQSNEVGGSYHMEKEGLTRSLDLLDRSGVKLDCIITDRHPQVQKFLRERKITHYYDVWHMAKGVLHGMAHCGQQFFGKAHQ